MRRARPKRPVLIAQWKASHRKIEEALSMSIEYFLGSLEARSTEKRATMKESVLHKIAMIAAVVSVGAAPVAIDALARDGGGGMRGSHFDRTGRAHLGDSVRGGRTDTIGGYQFVGGLHHYEWFR
jgi:hypothetical protein